MDTRERNEGKKHPLKGMRVGIFGKGGTGKSTVSVLFAKELAARGYDVYLLDADSTNVGLHRGLGLQAPPEPLIEYFGGMVFGGGAVTCPVDDPTPLPGSDLMMGELPSSYFRRSDENVVLMSGGKLGDFGPGAGCDGPISKIARDVEIRGPQDHSLTLVDLKAGIEDFARGVITKLDWIVVVVDPSLAAIQVAKSLATLVNQIQAGATPATTHLEDPSLAETAKRMYEEARVKGVMAVLNRVPDRVTEMKMEGEISKEGLLHLIGALKEDGSIRDAWLEGRSIESEENRDRVTRMVDRIEAAVADSSGLDPETVVDQRPALRVPG
ncbi:MAG: P-loop NTPase [Gemmatimonadota bacterium]